MKRQREEENETNRLEQDFSGEFGEIRTAAKSVNPTKLITESRPFNPLKHINLTRIDDGSENEADSDDEIVNLIPSHSIKTALANPTQSNTSPKLIEIETHKKVKLPKLVRITETDNQEAESSSTEEIKIVNIEKKKEEFVVEDTNKAEQHDEPSVIHSSKSNTEKTITSPVHNQNLETTDKESNEIIVPQVTISQEEPEHVQKTKEVNESIIEQKIEKKSGTGEDLQHNENEEENDDLQEISSDSSDDSDFFDAMNDINEISAETEIANLKEKILKKLTGKSETKPYNLDCQFDTVYKLLKSTVLKGGKSSSFIYGPRNCGKTAVFESALRKLRTKLHDSKDFILIRISGLLQDDDKLAVRSIAEQLDSELSRIYGIDLEDLESSELFSTRSITTTFANILKILDDELNTGKHGSAKIETPIVFVIDEVEQYANQARQTLLYNLFDLVETSRTPICVLCFTKKATIKETLEKRVRSRFSQRTIQFNSLPLDEFIQTGKSLLSIDKPSNPYEKQWNIKIEELINDKNSQLKRLLALNHMSTGSIKVFQNYCVYPISKVNESSPFLLDEHFAKYRDNLKRASYKSIINSLSDLELFLLVSAARVIAKKDLNWVNLNLCYEEYESQIKTKNLEISSKTTAETVTKTGLKQWSKLSCRAPWEVLQTIGFLIHTSQSSDFSSNSFESRLWQLEVTLDELRIVVDKEKAAKSWTRL